MWALSLDNMEPSHIHFSPWRVPARDAKVMVLGAKNAVVLFPTNSSAPVNPEPSPQCWTCLVLSLTKLGVREYLLSKQAQQPVKKP
jgi:hypothetical protein